MPRPETTVPKFGDWDGNEDLSYSIVFDRARADKEKFIPAPKKDPKNPSLEKQELKPSGFYTERGMLDKPSARSSESGNENLQNRFPKLPPKYNNQGFSDVKPLQTARRDQSEISKKGSVDSSSNISSGQQSTSVASLQKSASQEPKASANGSYIPTSNDGFHGQMHRVPGPTRQMYQDHPVMSKFMRSHGSSETSSIADMPEKGNLPKFGEWDVNDANAGEGFTVIFDRARDEKKSKGSQKGPTRLISPARPANDLYQNADSRKKKRGWPSILVCCADTRD